MARKRRIRTALVALTCVGLLIGAIIFYTEARARQKYLDDHLVTAAWQHDALSITTL